MTEKPAPQRALLPLWAAVLAAALAALMMDLAYPEAAIWILAFPATALLLVALIGRRFGGALLVGLVYGILFFALLVSWTSRYLGPVPWAALSVVEGVLTAVALVPIALAYRWMPKAFPGPQDVSWGFPLSSPPFGSLGSCSSAPGPTGASPGHGSA